MDHFRSIKYAFKVASHILDLVLAVVTVVIMLCCCSCSDVVLLLYCTTVLLLVVARAWPHDRSVGGGWPRTLDSWTIWTMRCSIDLSSIPAVRLEAGTRLKQESISDMFDFIINVSKYQLNHIDMAGILMRIHSEGRNCELGYLVTKSFFWNLG